MGFGKIVWGFRGQGLGVWGVGGLGVYGVSGFRKILEFGLRLWLLSAGLDLSKKAVLSLECHRTFSDTGKGLQSLSPKP